MASGEAFTILAILEARDRISDVMERVDGTLNQFSATSDRAAESARIAGTAIDESFLQTASGADAAAVATANLGAAQTRLRIATMEQAGAERELLALHQQMIVTGGNDTAVMDAQAAAYRRLSVAQREAATASADLQAAEARQAVAASGAGAASAAAGASSSAAGSAAAASAGGFRTARNAMLGVGVAAAAVIYGSVKAATSFQTLTTRLVTSAGESAKNLELVRKGILDVSNATGVMADDVAKNMYVVESAGYHGADGVKVLSAATEGAKIEGAEFGTVAGAVTDVLKDYHYSADKAGLATSQLIKAVAYGKTNFQNLSSAMNSVLPFASSLGLKLEDVVGVLANMTAHGMTAQRSAMNIANAMRSLAAPTNVMSKEFKLFGITSHDVQASLGTRGLAGTMQWLSGIAQTEAPKVGQTYNEALKKLMGTATGFQVALMSTGENTKDVNAAIKGIGDAATEAGNHVEGFGAVQDTMAFKMDQIKTAIHNAGITLGTAFIPALTQAAGWIAKVVGPLANWISHHEKLTAIVLTSLVALGALAAIISVIGAVVTVLTSEVGLVVIAVIALGVALAYAYTHSERFREIMDAIGRGLKTAWDATLKAVAVTIKWFSTNVVPLIQAAISALFGWFSSHQKQFSDAWNAMAKGVQDAAKWFNDNVIQWIKDRIQELIDWWHQHSDEIVQVWHFMWNAMQTAAKAWYDGVFKPLLTVLKAFWKGSWEAMRDTFKLVWAVISSTATTLMHLIENTIGVILDVITGHWGRAWKDLKKTVTQAFSDVITAIKSVTKNFGTLLYDAGQNIVKGLINGIKSMIGGAKNAISDVVGGIKKYVPWSPAKEGPLSGSGAPEIGGANITKLLAKGILSGKGSVTAAMGQVTGAAVRQMSGVPGTPLAGVGGLGLGSSVAGLTRGGAGNIVVIQNDFKGAQVIGEQAMDQLADRVGRRVATRILPGGGVRIRM